MNTFIIKQKIISRKNIAKSLVMLKKASLDKRAKILKSILEERNIINYRVDENSIDNFRHLVYNTRQAAFDTDIPGVSSENLPTIPLDKVNIGQFVAALEKDVKLEEQHMSSSIRPSQNELQRWARKIAFLQYYKNMNISSEQPITKIDGDDKTLRQLAPNTSSIFQLYIEKLEELRRRRDKYRLEDSEFNDALYGGIPQGGAFEKWIERHREEILQNIR